MKVYVLSDGCYSDWRIVGIFSSTEKAEEFKNCVGRKSEYNDIEEYEVDSDIPQMIRNGYSLYDISMIRDGRVIDAEKIKPSIGEAIYANDFNVNDGIMSGSVWAKDLKHAVKIANEQRVMIIANGKWRD